MHVLHRWCYWTGACQITRLIFKLGMVTVPAGTKIVQQGMPCKNMYKLRLPPPPLPPLPSLPTRPAGFKAGHALLQGRSSDCDCTRNSPAALGQENRTNGCTTAASYSTQQRSTVGLPVCGLSWRRRCCAGLANVI